MINSKSIPLVTAEKSGSYEVRVVNRKTPKESNRQDQITAFLIELRNNPLLLTSCADPNIYGAKNVAISQVPIVDISPTATPVSSSSVAPSASPSINPNSDFYTGHYNYPSGDYRLAYFMPNPKNENFIVELAARAHESEIGSRVEDNKKAAELYYSINFKPQSWDNFSGYTGIVKKMSLSKLAYSEITPQEFHNIHGADTSLVVGTNSALNWKADLIVDDSAKLNLRFMREQSTFAYKIAASFAFDEVKTPASASISILKTGDPKYNGDVVFLATDRVPDETPSDYYTGKNSPQRIYTGIKDSTGTIKSLFIYPNEQIPH